MKVILFMELQHIFNHSEIVPQFNLNVFNASQGIADMIKTCNSYLQHCKFHYIIPTM